MSRAEQELRAAFERLKADTPEALPKGTRVTQNNVAREAGKDPSAFKKTRYPALITEIQHYIAAVGEASAVSSAQATRKKRKKNRDLETRLNDAVKERDHAMSLLVGADSKVIELYQRIADLEARLPPSPVRGLSNARG